MKIELRNACLTAAVMAALYGPTAVQARDLIWDATGASAPTGTDGDGTWDTASTNWVDTATGLNTTFSNAIPDSARFGLSTTVTTEAAPFTIILNEDITVMNLTLASSAAGNYYDIIDQGDGGQTLTLAGNFTKAAPSGTPRFQLTNALQLTAGNHVFAINDTGGDVPELRMNNAVAGAGGLTLDNGAFQAFGTLIFNVNNTYEGATNLAKGRLIITQANGLGSTAAGTTISNAGTLSLGGRDLPAGDLTINEAITITRSQYAGVDEPSNTDFGNYNAAIIAANDGPSNTHTFNGPVTIDSTDARIQVNSNRVVFAQPFVAGPTVAPGTAVASFDGDFAGFVQLSADNTSFAAAGGALRILGGVEVEASSEANLGGPTSKLFLSGGTIRPTGTLGAPGSAFLTNFGAHDLSGAPVNTGLNLDASQTFTVNNLSGQAIGTRGTGTINFTGTNAFTGVPFFDGGTANVTGTTSFGAIRLRNAVFNVNNGGTVNTTGSFTNIGSDAPDNGTLNIGTVGTGTFNNTGQDFNITDGPGSSGTVNVGPGGTLTSGPGIFVGKANNANAVLNQTGGTINANRGGQFSLTVGGRSENGGENTNTVGTFTKTGGELFVAGETFVGNRPGTTGTWNHSGGTSTLRSWTTLGRQGSVGVLNLSGGTINRTDGGNTFVDEGNDGTTSTMTVSGTGSLVISAGELWVGQGGGTGILNVQDTGSISVDNWLAVGREGGTGTVNQSGGSVTKTGGGFLTIGGNGGATGTYTQTGGTLTSNAVFVGENDNGTLTLSGGTSTFTGQFYVGLQGGANGTLNINPGATVTVGEITVGERDAATGTVNLNGGTLNVNLIRGVTATGGRTVNFNGTNVIARGDNAAFIGGLTAANVQAGGANLDTNGFTVTANQALLAGTGGGGLTKSGLGTLTLASANTYTGATNVNAGTLNFGRGLRTSSGLTVAGGAKAAVLNNGVGSNAGTSDLPTLSLAGGATPTATFDLGDNAAILRNGSVSTTTSQIRQAFENGGNFDWNGIGLTSAAAAARALTDAATGVGVVSNIDLGYASFEGVNGLLGTAEEVLLKYTYLGDTDLDGDVDGDDFSGFLAGAGAGAGGWVLGDFDYNLLVNGDDFSSFIAGYNAFLGSGPLLISSGEVNAMFAQAQAGTLSFEAFSAVVPEPTGLLIFAAVGAGVLRRRRAGQV